MSTDAMMLGLFDFFEWAFRSRLDPRQRSRIADEVLAGWTDDDPSEQMLVLEILQARANVMMMDSFSRENYRPHVAQQLRAAMMAPRSDDGGRVLRVIWDCVEANVPDIADPQWGGHVETLATAPQGAPRTAPAAAAESDAAYRQRVNDAQRRMMDAHNNQMAIIRNIRA